MSTGNARVLAECLIHPHNALVRHSGQNAVQTPEALVLETCLLCVSFDVGETDALSPWYH